MTNGDKFRAMSDKNLAAFLLRVNMWCEHCFIWGNCPLDVRSKSKQCHERMENWLKQEAKDE